MEPKSFRLLTLLVERPDLVVRKEEILQSVWEGTAVTDNALTRAVAQIRKALNDDPREPRFIETAPTVGYRFIGTVKQGPVTVEQVPTLKRRSRASLGP